MPLPLCVCVSERDRLVYMLSWRHLPESLYLIPPEFPSNLAPCVWEYRLCFDTSCQIEVRDHGGVSAARRRMRCTQGTSSPLPNPPFSHTHCPLQIPRCHVLECPRETLSTSLSDSLVPDIDPTPHPARLTAVGPKSFSRQSLALVFMLVW